MNENNVIKYGDMFIHEYAYGDGGYCIGAFDREPFIDEEEASYLGLTVEKYHHILNPLGAKQYWHEFVYSETDKKLVCDTYFTDLERCKKGIDALMNNK